MSTLCQKVRKIADVINGCRIFILITAKKFLVLEVSGNKSLTLKFLSVNGNYSFQETVRATLWRVNLLRMRKKRAPHTDYEWVNSFL